MSSRATDREAAEDRTVSLGTTASAATITLPALEWTSASCMICHAQGNPLLSSYCPLRNEINRWFCCPQTDRPLRSYCPLCNEINRLFCRPQTHRPFDHTVGYVIKSTDGSASTIRLCACSGTDSSNLGLKPQLRHNLSSTEILYNLH